MNAETIHFEDAGDFCRHQRVSPDGGLNRVFERTKCGCLFGRGSGLRLRRLRRFYGDFDTSLTFKSLISPSLQRKGSKNILLGNEPRNRQGKSATLRKERRKKSIQRDAAADVGGDVEVLAAMNGGFAFLEAALGNDIEREAHLLGARAFAPEPAARLRREQLLGLLDGEFGRGRNMARIGTARVGGVGQFVIVSTGEAVTGSDAGAFIAFIGARGDEGDGQFAGERFKDSRAHDDVRVFAMAIDLFHDAIDFGHGQVGTACKADENGVGFGEHLAAFEEGMGDEFIENFAGAIFAGGLDGGERAFLMTAAQDGAEIVEIHVDEAGMRDETPDAADALGEEIVGDFEPFVDAGVFVNEFENLLVGHADDAIGGVFQFAEAELGLTETAGAFKFKRESDDAEDEGVVFAGKPRDHGAGAGASAAAQTGDDANDVRPRTKRAEFFRIFFGGSPAHVGIATGAETAGEFGAESEAVWEGQLRERLGIRVDGGEADASKLLAGHVFDGIAARTADTDDLDDEFIGDGVVCRQRLAGFWVHLFGLLHGAGGILATDEESRQSQNATDKADGIEAVHPVNRQSFGA
jgi:hypothetical protein